MGIALTVDELRAILAGVLPRAAFWDAGIHSGKVTWTFPDNMWKLSYAAGSGGHVGAVHFQDERGMATVSLNREGLGSMLPILKAVGAV